MQRRISPHIAYPAAPVPASRPAASRNLSTRIAGAVGAAVLVVSVAVIANAGADAPAQVLAATDLAALPEREDANLVRVAAAVEPDGSATNPYTAGAVLVSESWEVGLGAPVRSGGVVDLTLMLRNAGSTAADPAQIKVEFVAADGTVGAAGEILDVPTGLPVGQVASGATVYASVRALASGPGALRFDVTGEIAYLHVP